MSAVISPVRRKSNSTIILLPLTKDVSASVINHCVNDTWIYSVHEGFKEIGGTCLEGFCKSQVDERPKTNFGQEAE